MKLYDDGEFTALNWVKPALDATLAQARESLETYVEEPDNITLMRSCAEHLHQVQGTLRMVELYGAAMVVENMERLAEALVADTIKQRDEGYSVLMRGMVQLPDYLERLQSGHKDIPIVLLPLLNDLRAVRGENLLSESALFSPDLGLALPEAAAGSAAPAAPAELRAQALRLRLAFQAALLKWFRDSTNGEHLRRLMDVLDRLRAISHGVEPRRLWWVAAGVVEAVENRGLEPSVAVKLLFGRVDREIHRFAEGGEAAFAARPPRELVKNLLYYIAHSGSNGVAPGSRSAEIRRTYRLDTLLPTQSELQHAQGSMTGRNKNLLGTVSAAIKDDLVRVKEALDIFLRGHNTDASELAAQAEVLNRVGDTLGMLGLGVPRRVVGEQREIIEEMSQHRRPVDEGALLDVAGALLYVEASLDDHIERLGDGGDGEAPSSGELELPKAEVRRILDALMREAAVNIQQAKQDIIAFIESPWDHQRVQQIPRLLEEIAGALRMLGLANAAELMTAVVRFVEVELIAHKRVPTAEQMDKLADALAAIEYYLEATREQRRNRDKILDVARESLEALGYWPLPPAELREKPVQAPEPPRAAPAAERTGTAPAAPPAAPSPVALEPGVMEHPAANATPTIDVLPGRDLHDLVVGEARQAEPESHDISGLRLAQTDSTGGVAADEQWIEVEEEIEEEVAAGEQPLAGFEGAAAEEIDDDIREVFLEEVDEEITNLRNQLPVWKRDTGNLEELKPIRRSFHTLKGSGRLVGALTLGEFSWKVENMLNRVLDRTILPGDAVVSLVDHAVGTLPALLAALRGDAGASANVAGIMDTADRVAAGEDARVPAAASGTRTVRRTVRRRVPAPVREQPSLHAEVQATGSLTGDTAAVAAPAAAAQVVAGPLPNIDPVLFDILQSEVAAHLGVVDEYVANCEPEAIRASESLLRAVHTLNGAIAMVDIPSIGNVLAPLETYIKRLRAADRPPLRVGVAAMRDTAALTRDVMHRLETGNAQLPDSSALAARMVALRDSLPEPEASLTWYSDVAEMPASVATDAAPAEADVPPEPFMEAASLSPASTTETSVDDWLRDAHEAIAMADSELPPQAQIPDDLAAALAEFEKLPTLPTGTQEETPVIEQATDIEAMSAGLPVEEISLEASSIDVPEVEDIAPGAPAIDAPPAVDGAGIANVPFPDAGELQVEEVELDSTSAPDTDFGGFDDAAATPPAVESEAAGPSFPADAESAPEPAAPAAPVGVVPGVHAPLGGREAPPLAEDPQPDGALEAADADDDLLDIFVTESEDILDHADTVVASLRESPHDRAHIVALQRDLHTLKGGARMAGLAPIGDLSHAMESLVDAVSDGRLAVDRAAVESLERGFDRLHVLVQRVAQRKALAMPLHAIARFEALVAGEDLHRGVTPAAAATPAATQPAAAPAAADTAPASRPVPRHLTAMDQEDVERAPQEMIRVRSELLDSLVNFAGEVSIYRSRLEQQISNFRFNLVEFEQTVNRLREQLRKLEIETEAQIIARYQREQHDSTSTFDPLELDRFSQLQQLSRALSESVSDLVSIQGILDEQTRQSETLLLQQSRVSSELQEGLMRTRMVPFDSLVPNLRRTLRQAAQEIGKRAQLKVDGAHGEMDRNLLERMKAPFEHMLRNALAHGIEKPDERVAAGKPAEGTVNIAVSREATEVVLRITDDGRGMDRDAIRRKAIERGLLKPDVQLSDRDLYGFILETGFSTAEQVTQLAGRGVGMDVVNNEIKQLGGSLTIDSKIGQGTQFTIRLPFTLAVTQAILVKLGESSYAIPMSSVQGVARIAHDDLERRIAEGNPKHNYAGEEFSIYELSQLLGLPRPRTTSDDTQIPLLMTRTGDQRAAVRIDGVVGSREIVVKSVGPQVSSVPGIFGATIMGDGSVVMILDLAPLVRRLAALRARIDAGAIEELPAFMAPEPEQPSDVRAKPLVMVVDDSITMRKVTTRVLERADFEVLTAKDGLDALEKLQETVPDIMLLDIEMPRMDGYELATYMRNDSRLRKVPIIMITSRTGEKHRQRAFEIGVERYLGKPYQEDDLLRQVQEVLRRERV
ncbi:Hpt domain-containing protein [Dokdonella fugitiva]|uniref:Hpt domain-containing protein n=1 Tax=Dokdonella fugitiva TaxID=328517 RepID=UPI0015FAEE33|nr:Hpt domain-containing protein [Dokdonella fugitiva]MBA8882474.1 chemosensory pili system protein ChpA (sensor histidine kinase/response regulator) [Dokdonella fugitiva]